MLLAAALATLAIVPIAAAYLQLGAHPDVSARTDPGVTSERVLQGIDRAVVNASTGVSGTVAWSDRERALARFTVALADDVRAIERGAVTRSTVVRVTRNTSAARAWADDHCPGGPNRAFGDCVVENGVLLQERAGDTHVVAVGLDVTVADRRGETRLTVVVTVP